MWISGLTGQGACNPGFAHKALLEEPEIGAMLLCNVIVQEIDGGIRILAIGPVASIQAVENAELAEVLTQVQTLLRGVIEAL
jgi:uncharacterized protein (DUF302 family)